VKKIFVFALPMLAACTFSTEEETLDSEESVEEIQQAITTSALDCKVVGAGLSANYTPGWCRPTAPREWYNVMFNAAGIYSDVTPIVGTIRYEWDRGDYYSTVVSGCDSVSSSCVIRVAPQCGDIDFTVRVDARQWNQYGPIPGTPQLVRMATVGLPGTDGDGWN
jgi:hypothetical protein